MRENLLRSHQIQALDASAHGRGNKDHLVGSVDHHQGSPDLAPHPSTSLIHHKPRKHTFKSSWALVWWRFDPRAGVECHIDWSDRHRNWTRDLAPNQPWVTANCHWECLYTIGLDGDASKVSGNLPLGRLTPQGAIASPLSPTSTHMAPTHYKYVCWRHGRASLKIKERRSSRS
jgi:hypothetical protein